MATYTWHPDCLKKFEEYIDIVCLFVPMFAILPFN